MPTVTLMTENWRRAFVWAGASVLALGLSWGVLNLHVNLLGFVVLSGLMGFMILFDRESAVVASYIIIGLGGLWSLLALYAQPELPRRDFLAGMHSFVNLMFWAGLVLDVFFFRKKEDLRFLDKVLLLWLGVQIAQIFNPENTISSGVYGIRTFGLYFIFYWVGKRYARNRGSITPLLYAMALTATAVNAYGIWRSISGPTPLDKVMLELKPIFLLQGEMQTFEGSVFLSGRIRPYNTGISPSGYKWPAIALVVLVFLWRSEECKRLGWVRWTAVLSFPLLLMLFPERTPMALAFVGLVSGSLIFLRTPEVRSYALTGFIIGALLVGALAVYGSRLAGSQSLVLRRVSELANPIESGGTMAWRVQRWPRFWNDAVAQPWGHGLGITKGTRNEGRRPNELLDPHNFYLKQFYETGLPGLLLFLTAVGTVAWMGGRAALGDWDTTTRRLGAGLFGTSCMLLVLALPHNILTNAEAMLFWSLAGVLVERMTRKPESVGADSDRSAK